MHHGVVLRRVTYWTELGGQPQLATGLLGIQSRHQARTSVMWLNGTNPTRSEAPSAGGLVGLLVAAVQRALEASPIDEAEVLAVASVAPPLDLANVTLPWALEGRAPSHSTYLAYIAHSYARAYGQPLESLLTDDAAALVTELFDGLHAADDIAGRLPPTPRPMFRDSWVDDYLAGGSSWFRSAVEENEAVRWAPRAPLRLYYGAADVDVHPDDALLGAREMGRRGGNVEAVAVGEFDHASVVYHAVPLVQEWFSRIRGE